MTDDELYRFLGAFEVGDIDYALTSCNWCGEDIDCATCFRRWLFGDANDYKGLLADKGINSGYADRKTDQMTDDLIRKSDVLETYAGLYDIFDDNKAIQEELHKVFDKINDIPAVEPNSSEKPNNSTISKMEQVDKDINVRSKDEPQTERSNE